MLLIFALRIAEITLEKLPHSQVKEFILVITGVALGVVTFFQAPSVMTLLSELTHPVATAIPHLVMFWMTAVLTLVICQRGYIV